MSRCLAMTWQVQALAFHLWSGYCKSKIKSDRDNAIHHASNGVSPKRSSMSMGSVDQGLDWCIECFMRIEQRSQFHWFTLLIEWDKQDAIRDVLKGIESNHYFNKASLNRSLQVALENNRSLGSCFYVKKISLPCN